MKKINSKTCPRQMRFGEVHKSEACWVHVSQAVPESDFGSITDELLMLCTKGNVAERSAACGLRMCRIEIPGE